MATSRRNVHHKAAHGLPRNTKVTDDGGVSSTLLTPQALRNVQCEKIIIVFILLLGAYLSILYYGHKVVPTSDFTAFTDVGHKILAFEKPNDFKRVPLLGILQITLSKIVGGQYPLLSGGWLLNGILYPFIGLLVYLIGRQFVGRAAVALSVMVLCNPQMLVMLVDPIAEITLIFFMLLSIYLILKRSKWCYLFAFMAMMTRYEGAGLIVIAFIYDCIEAKGLKNKFKCITLPAICGIPLLLWVFAIISESKATDAVQGGINRAHYIRNYGHTSVFGDFNAMVSKDVIENLLTYFADGKMIGLGLLIQIVASLLMCIGVVYAIRKKQWSFFVLVGFFLQYYLVHCLRNSTRVRYAIPIFWMVLFFCWYGGYGCWYFVKGKQLPNVVKYVSGGILLFAMLIWSFFIMDKLQPYHAYSPMSKWIPILPPLGLVVVTLLIKWRDTTVKLLPMALMASMVFLMLMSSHYMRITYVGQGARDYEFKLLADWFSDNSKKGDTLVTTLNSVVKLYAPKLKHNIYSTSSFKAKTPAKFLRKLNKGNVTYIAWDSRLGYARGNKYYKKWGLKEIAMLQLPKTNGPYEYITQLKQSEHRYINVFKVHRVP